MRFLNGTLLSFNTACKLVPLVCVPVKFRANSGYPRMATLWYMLLFWQFCELLLNVWSHALYSEVISQKRVNQVNADGGEVNTNFLQPMSHINLASVQTTLIID